MSDDDTIIDVHAGDDLSPLAGTWRLDPSHSALEFVARYAVFTLVRGRFTSFSGTVVIDPHHREATQIDVSTSTPRRSTRRWHCATLTCWARSSSTSNDIPRNFVKRFT